MMGVAPDHPDSSEFVEVDPTGRYGRYNEILGKGSSKTVYKAFDEYGGIEVAWNQVKLYDILRTPEDLERLYCEIHLLKTLKHKNIMKFYTSWVDTKKRNINFVTEMFSSGTLRQYRHKHRRVNIRAVKNWCRQILSGLLYLHSRDPPVIHRDLKCDNIFVNGNQGEVKIGDLGLAAILRQSHVAHCVGTPEFMAPEVYEEEYNELVDIYSFGMCILEMVTFDYPYSECTHPAQIYKKVISGTKPEALYKVKDPELKQFVEKCLANASERLSARNLLNDPFLQIEELGSGYNDRDIYGISDVATRPSLNPINSKRSSLNSGFSEEYEHRTETDNGWGDNVTEVEIQGIDLVNIQEEDGEGEHFAYTGITIKGRRKQDGTVFLKLRIREKGHVRNIHFPFDVEGDTALTVATEMVAELDILDYEVTGIADMIDGEVSSLVPKWKRGPGIEEALENSSTILCHNCASTVSSCGSLFDYLSATNPGCGNLQSARCPNLECASMHGRFQEITYQAEESKQCVTEGAPTVSASEAGNIVSREGSGSVYFVDDVRQTGMNGHVGIGLVKSTGVSFSDSIKPEFGKHHPLPDLPDDKENEIRHELRWLKAKYQIELRDYRYQQIEELMGELHQSPDLVDKKCNDGQMKSFHLGTHFSFPIPSIDIKPIPAINGYFPYGIAVNCSTSRPDEEVRMGQHCEVNPESSPEKLFRAKSFYAGAYQPISRSKSLLVDAVHIQNL